MEHLKIGIAGGGGQGMPAWDFAELAEKLGFDSIWTGEHFTNWRPTLTTIPVMGTFIPKTRTIKIGTSIMLFPLRHPTVVAKEVGALDILSGGRIILGIGVGGENPKEYEACGVPVKERGARSTEGIQIVKRLWTEESVTFKGRFFQMENITMVPKPVQKPHPPIVVGGRRDGAMRRAARHADGWLPYLYTPEMYQSSVEKIKGYAAEAGRDLSGFVWGFYQFMALEKTYEEAHKMAATWLQAAYRQDFTTLAPKYCVLGTPSHCVEGIERLVEAGVRHLILVPLGRGEAAMEKVNTIASDILPHFRKKRTSG